MGWRLRVLHVIEYLWLNQSMKSGLCKENNNYTADFAPN